MMLQNIVCPTLTVTGSERSIERVNCGSVLKRRYEDV